MISESDLRSLVRHLISEKDAPSRKKKDTIDTSEKGGIVLQGTGMIETLEEEITGLVSFTAEYEGGNRVSRVFRQREGKDDFESTIIEPGAGKTPMTIFKLLENEKVMQTLQQIIPGPSSFVEDEEGSEIVEYGEKIEALIKKSDDDDKGLVISDDRKNRLMFVCDEYYSQGTEATHKIIRITQVVSRPQLVGKLINAAIRGKVITFNAQRKGGGLFSLGDLQAAAEEKRGVLTAGGRARGERKP